MPDNFKELVWDALVKLALAKLFAAIPWLGWGPIGLIVGFFVSKLADYLFSAIDLTVDLQVIAFKNAGLRKAFDDASVKLMIIAKDKGINSPEYLEARNAHKKRLSEFVGIAS